MSTTRIINMPRSQRLFDADRAGQSAVELAVLVLAATMGIVVMSAYLKKSFNAHGEAIERQLNGATEENTPGIAGGG